MSQIWFGSVFNRIDGMVKNVPEPKVGDGATRLLYSDRHAGTVVDVTKAKDGSVKSFVVQDDKHTRIDNNGFSESQEYAYEANPNGRRTTFKKVSKGRFKGVWRSNGRLAGDGVKIGERDEYHDFSF